MSQEPEPQLQFEPSPTLSLGGAGWVLIALGVVASGAAFFLDVTVPVSLTERVANVDKIAMRHMVLASGLTVFLSGWVLVAAGTVVKAIGRR